MHRPDLGYYDEGWDLRDPTFYADPDRHLPPSAIRSLAFTHLEDESVWTRDWVCVGEQADIPGEGDLLPFTVGDHGVHVQRMADGGLAARFNKAQHGGCRAVPLQCQTGVKTRCSFTSCGHSRDRGPIPAGELGDGTPEMHQYLGLRPERLLTAHVAGWGPMIFVNLDVKPIPLDRTFAGLAPSARFFGNHKAARVDHFWMECEANWKLAAWRLADCAAHATGEDWATGDTTVGGDQPAVAALLFPNLIVIAAATQTLVVVVQPTAIGQTLCRVGVHGAPGDALEATCGWRAEIATRLDRARRDQGVLSRWGTQSSPETVGAKPPPLDSAIGRWGRSALARRVLALPVESSAIPLFQTPR